MIHKPDLDVESEDLNHNDDVLKFIVNIHLDWSSFQTNLTWPYIFVFYPMLFSMAALLILNKRTTLPRPLSSS